jgi:hypothetical protein
MDIILKLIYIVLDIVFQLIMAYHDWSLVAVVLARWSVERFN